MKKKRIRELAAGLLALVGVASCEHAPVRTPESSSLGPLEVVDAKTTQEGRVVLHEWTVGGETRRAELGGDYGLMVYYDAAAAEPAPRFALYLGESAEVVQTTSLSRFKQQLGRIPAGGTLHYYNTCGGGTHSGLNPAVLDEFREHCADRGVRFQRGDDTLFSICVCR